MKPKESINTVEYCRNALVAERVRVSIALPSNRALKDYEGTLVGIYDLGLEKIRTTQGSVRLRCTPFWFLYNLEGSADHIFINQKYIVKFLLIEKGYTISKKEGKKGLQLSQKELIADLTAAEVSMTIVNNNRLVEIIEGTFFAMYDLHDIYWYVSDIKTVERKTSEYKEGRAWYRMENIACFKILKTRDGDRYGTDDFWAMRR